MTDELSCTEKKTPQDFVGIHQGNDADSALLRSNPIFSFIVYEIISNKIFWGDYT